MTKNTRKVLFWVFVSIVALPLSWAITEVISLFYMIFVLFGDQGGYFPMPTTISGIMFILVLYLGMLWFVKYIVDKRRRVRLQ